MLDFTTLEAESKEPVFRILKKWVALWTAWGDSVLSPNLSAYNEISIVRPLWGSVRNFRYNEDIQLFYNDFTGWLSEQVGIQAGLLFRDGQIGDEMAVQFFLLYLIGRRTGRFGYAPEEGVKVLPYVDESDAPIRKLAAGVFPLLKEWHWDVVQKHSSSGSTRQVLRNLGLDTNADVIAEITTLISMLDYYGARRRD